MRLSSRLLGVLVLAIVWESVSRLNLLPAVFFPPLSTVITSLWKSLREGSLFADELLSLQRAGTGMMIASVLAISLAILTTSSRIASAMAAPLVEFLRPLPPAAIIPLAVFFVGIGPGLFIFTIVFAAIWPIYVSAANALGATDQTLIETGRSFGCGRLALLSQVRLPNALPEVVTGLRVGMGLAILATVLVEMLAGRGGIGYRLYETAFSLRTAEMYGVMILTGFNGILCNLLIIYVGRHLVGWHFGMTARGEDAAISVR